jgi:hypothetical protein
MRYIPQVVAKFCSLLKVEMKNYASIDISSIIGFYVEMCPPKVIFVKEK